MAIDIRKFLKDMKFTDAQVEAMAPNFGADQLSALEDGYVGPDERAKVASGRAEVDALKAKYEEADAKLNDQITAWANSSAADQQANSAMSQRVEKAEADLVAMRHGYERALRESGIDPATVLPKVEAVKVEPKVEAVDTSKFVPRDEHGKLTNYLLDLPASLYYIGEQHKELFGQPLDPREINREIRKRAAKGGDPDPVKIWEELHNVPAKRAERESASRAAEIKAAEERGEERARTSFSIPGASSVSHSRRPSPVLNPVRHADGRVGPRQSVLQRPVPGESRNRALAALRTGKYAAK